MRATIDWIESNFARFNEKYFNNALQMPDVIRTNSRCSKTLGQVTYRRNAYSNPEIILMISTYYDRPEKGLQQTLLHEMIHVYQRQTYGTGGHGAIFQREAERINRDGWNISRLHDLTEELGNDFYEQRVQKSIKDMRGKYCGIIKREGNEVFVFCIVKSNLDRMAVLYPKAVFYPIEKAETFSIFPITGNGWKSLRGKVCKVGSQSYNEIMDSVGEAVSTLSVYER